MYVSLYPPVLALLNYKIGLASTLSESKSRGAVWRVIGSVDRASLVTMLRFNPSNSQQVVFTQLLEHTGK
jgi:hypothetical protein